MKENELRVGVNIYYCDMFYTVDAECIKMHMGDEQDDAYQPIPLTEDILLKCGFKELKQSKGQYVIISENNNAVQLEILFSLIITY